MEVAAASRRAIAASYTGTAPLEPRAESQVVAKTSGVALNVMVEEGQSVRAGQVLVRLDPDRATLQAAQSAAQMRKLEANYKRSQQLAAQQLVSANDLDQLKYDLENARAVNRLANLELSYANVVAPISGVIASRSIKTGNFVQINTPIFRIVDDSRLEATLNVPERELATLKPGLPVVLVVDALPGKIFKGTVDRIAPVVDSGSGTFRVISTFDGSGAAAAGHVRPHQASTTTSAPMRSSSRATRCSTTKATPRCSWCATARPCACRSSWATWTASGPKCAAASRKASRSSPPARSRCATARRCR